MESLFVSLFQTVSKRGFFLLDVFFKHPGGDISHLPQLLLSVCETVKDESLMLIDNMRYVSQTEDRAEDEDCMETDSPRGAHKDQRDGVREKELLWLFSMAAV